MSNLDPTKLEEIEETDSANTLENSVELSQVETTDNQQAEVEINPESKPNLDKKSLLNSNLFLSLVIIFSLFGVIFHLIPNTRGFLVNTLTEPLLFLVNLTLIGLFLWKYRSDKNFIPISIWLVITFLITLFLEIVGAATGLVFGEYSYGSVFEVKILEVPIIIGFNWVVLILAGSMIIDNWLDTINPFKNLKNEFLEFFEILLVAFLNSLLLGFFDWVLEPVAIFLDYWNWGDGNIPASQQTVPLQNYLAWMIITFFFTLFYKFLKFKFNFAPLKIYFVIQLIFMAALNFFFSLLY